MTSKLFYPEFKRQFWDAKDIKEPNYYVFVFDFFLIRNISITNNLAWFCADSLEKFLHIS